MNKKFFTIPNILSVARIIMVPFFVVLYMLEYYKISLVLFVLSGVTDVLDGWIARRFNQVSDIGKVLDLLADKLTMVSVLACLYFNHYINIIIFLVIVGKELFQVAGGIFLWKKKIVVSSNIWGKLTTVLLYAGIFAIFVFPDHTIGNIMLFVAIIIALIAMIQYIIKNRRVYSSLKEENKNEEKVVSK